MSQRAISQLAVAAILLAIATTLGAFAAHGLDRVVDAARIATFRTGVEYHFYNALGVLGIAILRGRLDDDRLLAASGWLLVAGIALFSGSLYLATFIALGPLAVVTPLGGLCSISGWLLAAYAALRLRAR